MKNDEKAKTRQASQQGYYAQQASKARRRLDRREMKRRGCEYCSNMLHIPHEQLELVQLGKLSRTGLKPSSQVHFCPFAECPYHELDAIKHDYVKEFDKPLRAGLRKLGR